jgi:MFS family permease
MVPQTISFIQMLFTAPKDRAKAIGTFGLVLGLASMLGQFLGGLFTYYHFAIAGWRLIFFINLPVGMAAIIAGWLFIKETPLHTGAKFDVSGAIILSSALFALDEGAIADAVIYAISQPGNVNINELVLRPLGQTR